MPDVSEFFLRSTHLLLSTNLRDRQFHLLFLDEVNHLLWATQLISSGCDLKAGTQCHASALRPEAALPPVPEADVYERGKVAAEIGVPESLGLWLLLAGPQFSLWPHNLHTPRFSDDHVCACMDFGCPFVFFLQILML